MDAKHTNYSTVLICAILGIAGYTIIYYGIKLALQLSFAFPQQQNSNNDLYAFMAITTSLFISGLVAFYNKRVPFIAKLLIVPASYLISIITIVVLNRFLSVFGGDQAIYFSLITTISISSILVALLQRTTTSRIPILIGLAFVFCLIAGVSKYGYIVAPLSWLILPLLIVSE